VTGPSHPRAGVPSRTGQTTLRELLTALGNGVVELLDAPAGENVTLASVAMVDDTDLAADIGSLSPMSDVYLLVGIHDERAIAWFSDIANRAAGHRPVAVLWKPTGSAEALAAAHRARVAAVAVHPRARWDQVFPLIQRVLGRLPSSADDPDLTATDTDLFELAQIVAQNAGGLVSIEDAQSQLLAYSATDDSADELRTLSILGREGPADYLQLLRQWGVFDQLQRADDVVEVPAHPELRTKRRLVVGIREPVSDKSRPAGLLGFIWVQQGDRPLAIDAAEVLRGAAAIAARTIFRSLNAPSTEGMLIQRLFGARGGGVDVPSLAGALNLPIGGPAAVIGLAAQPTGGATRSNIAAIGAVLRLHASAFRPDAVATIIGDRAYVLLPRYRSAAAVAGWIRQLVEQLETRHSVVLRAAIAAPVPDLGQVADARVEVDRVLDGTAGTFPVGRVTTLAESLTAVLLGEILDLLARQPDLLDPRLDALLDYDRDHAAQLRDSVQVYLDQHGDVRTAAAALQIHPNTLRYRVRRAEAILGMDLTNAADRLLLELQLSLRRRGSS
jgi:DNA-binding PucR family transcriptional regulator